MDEEKREEQAEIGKLKNKKTRSAARLLECLRMPKDPSEEIEMEIEFKLDG